MEYPGGNTQNDPFEKTSSGNLRYSSGAKDNDKQEIKFIYAMKSYILNTDRPQI